MTLNDPRIPRKVIKESTGIDLEWNEQIALKYYIRGLERYQKIDTEAIEEGIVRFMNDYFDLDWIGLGPCGIIDINKKGFEDVKHIGFDVTGTKNFKKYCREHVSMWRDERTLL